MWPPFSKARKLVQSFGFGGQREYKRHAKDIGLPLHPDTTYKDKGWNGWGDFLGNKNKPKRDYKAIPFAEAREIVHSWKLHSSKQYHWYNNICLHEQPPRAVATAIITEHVNPMVGLLYIKRNRPNLQTYNSSIS